MATRDVEVRTKLTLDDQASGALKRIKDGFGDVEEGQKRAAGGMGFFTATLANFAAMSIGPAARGLYDFAKGFLDAAAAGQDADQAIAGLITAVQGIPWKEAHDQAEALGDAIDEIGIAAGQPIDDVANAFQALIELEGASAAGIAKAKDEVAKMATVANVLGMSTEAIAREYGMMGEGMLRTRGRLFQLLQTTGIFGQNTKEAATYWAKLTEAQRTEALARGLEEVSGKLGKATPTFHDLLNSIENMWEVAKEKLGEPLLNALIPVMKDLVEKMKAGRGEIEAFAKSMSTDVKKWVEKAAKAIQDGFEWIKTHHEEIRDAIVDGVNTARGVVEFILAHKEEIALAFGVRAVAPVISAGAEVAKGVTGLAAQGIPGLGVVGTGGGIAAAGVALAAFTAAVVTAALAAEQAAKLYKEAGGTRGETGRSLDARLEYARQIKATAGGEWRQWSPQEVEAFGHIRESAVKEATELGEDSWKVGEAFDAAWAAHMDAVHRMQQIGESFERTNEEIRRLEEAGEDPGLAIGGITSMFTQAVQANDQGMAIYLATLLSKNKNLADTFIFAADLTGQSIDAFVSMVEGKASGLEELIKQLQERGAQTSAAPTTPAPKISMSGGQTFNIKQEFRDQDPDRVAFVFRRDIVRAAENRLQAITTSPFGT